MNVMLTSLARLRLPSLRSDDLLCRSHHIMSYLAFPAMHITNETHAMSKESNVWIYSRLFDGVGQGSCT